MYGLIFIFPVRINNCVNTLCHVINIKIKCLWTATDQCKEMLSRIMSRGLRPYKY